MKAEFMKNVQIAKMTIKNKPCIIVSICCAIFILMVVKALLESIQNDTDALLVSKYELSDGGIPDYNITQLTNRGIIDDDLNGYESEWHKRWNECDKIWLDSLNNVPKLQNNSDKVRVFNYSDTCFVNLDNHRGGIGNKFERQSLAFLYTSNNYCKLAIDWGWFESKCYDPTFYNKYNHTYTELRYNYSDVNSFNRNIFEYIWNDNLEFRAFVNTTKFHNMIHKNIMNNTHTIAINIDDDNNNFLNEYKNLKGPHKLAAQFYLSKHAYYHTFEYKKIERLKNNFDYLNKTFFYQNIEGEWFSMRPIVSDMSFFGVQRFYGLVVKNLHSIWRDKAIKFFEKEFRGYYIIGTHLRFGNGENFGYFKRQIGITINDIAKQFILLLQNINNIQQVSINNNTALKINISKIKIFIATDTFSMIDTLRDQIVNNVKGFKKAQIISLPQTRVSPNTGHLFSLARAMMKNSSVAMNTTKIDCVDTMAMSYLDSEILGLTDFLILPIGSTFTRLSRLLIIKRRKNLCIALNDNANRWKCINFGTYTNYSIENLHENLNDTDVDCDHAYDYDYDKLHKKWHLIFNFDSKVGELEIVDDFKTVHQNLIRWTKKQSKKLHQQQQQQQQDKQNIAPIAQSTVGNDKKSSKEKQLLSDIHNIDNLYYDKDNKNDSKSLLFQQMMNWTQQLQSQSTQRGQTKVDLSKYGQRWNMSSKQLEENDQDGDRESNLPSILFIAGIFGSGHDIIRRFAYLMHKKSRFFIMRQYSNHQFFESIRQLGTFF